VPFDIGTFVFYPEHEYFQAFPILADRFLRVRHRRLALRDPRSIDTYPLSPAGYLRDRGATGCA